MNTTTNHLLITYYFSAFCNVSCLSFNLTFTFSLFFSLFLCKNNTDYNFLLDFYDI